MSIDMFVNPEDDPRAEGSRTGDERAMLIDFLGWQRATLELKCRGLEPDDLARRSVEPSSMSLLGLIRHMAEVERNWFRRVISGEDAPPRFYSEADPDGDWDGAVADPAVVTEAWDAWRAEVARADEVVAGAADLDVLGHHPREGPTSLRWVLLHMIEEYARHNGHADLLRERIDGAVGQ